MLCLPGLVSLASAAACVGEDPSPTAGALPEAGSPDSAIDGGGGGNDAGVTDGTTSAGPNLFENGDFETNCVKWEPLEATLSPSTVAHSGSRSCRVCTANGLVYQVGQGVFTDAPVGAVFAGSAWIRRADGDPIAESIEGLMGTQSDSFKGLDYSPVRQARPLNDQWQKIEVDLAVETPGAAVVYLAISSRSIPTTDGDAGDGGAPVLTCFRIDDATLTRVK